MPRAAFLGHLAGIIMGYPLAWHALDWLQPPLLAALCAAAALHHAYSWPRMPAEIEPDMSSSSSSSSSSGGNGSSSAADTSASQR
jgi:hypothetical protein